MQKIIDGVFRYTVMGGTVNLYVIVQGDGLIVIDTGVSPKSIDGLAAALNDHGHSLDSVRHILITHAHYDHTGGLAALQERVPATTYAHRRDARVIRGEQPLQYAPHSDLQGLAWVMSFALAPNAGDPARVDVDLQDGDSVPPGMQVIELPGHSPGQVGFWWAERRILFGGDVMMSLPWGLRMPLRAPSPDWDVVKESIRRTADLDVDILCLGHGPVIESGAAAKIRSLVANRL
jgi:glyoxylase-like metal-dependent hydrolase (beta-lactamase superfamily II)